MRKGAPDAAASEVRPPTDAPVAPGGGGAAATTPLQAALRSEATSFEFFEAVRHIERLFPGSTPLGRSLDPAGEPVRFSAHPSISFPPSDIRSLDLDGEGPARMSVNFMGVTGPAGVLPYHYTLQVMERASARDTALRDFLDLFHHRLISLFYRAWEKHRFAATYEKGEDRLRGHLLDLVGMGLEQQQAALPFPADTLVYYAGLFVGRGGNAAALQQLLEDFFDAQVEVVQFVGDWFPVSRRDQCELGDEDTIASQLGLGSIAGDEVWDEQCKVRVRVGPLTSSRYRQFLPGGSAHELLRQLVRFFSRDELDFELQLVLARDDVPALVLGAEDDAGQPLGWSTWIRSAPRSRDADETLLAL